MFFAALRDELGFPATIERVSCERNRSMASPSPQRHRADRLGPDQPSAGIGGCRCVHPGGLPHHRPWSLDRTPRSPTRFADFRNELDIAPGVLANRLDRFGELGVFVQRSRGLIGGGSPVSPIDPGRVHRHGHFEPDPGRAPIRMPRPGDSARSAARAEPSRRPHRTECSPRRLRMRKDTDEPSVAACAASPA